MADNYLEKKFEDMRARASAQQAKQERLRQRAWKKRMDAYRKRLAEAQGSGQNAGPEAGPNAEQNAEQEAGQGEA